MTLDVIFHLMKLVSLDEYSSGANLSALLESLSAEKENDVTLAAFVHRHHILCAAHNDPMQAEALLAANLPKEGEPLPVLDFSGWPLVRYALSGELQTPESEAYFQNVTSAATILRAAIVDSERANNTPAIAILDKLLNLNGALPERYKKMANIPYA
ncbi:hypothetical protein EC036_20360 [Enterobacter cloacae]|uniref:Uncharacterized protein n=1 Tax=Enterobacter cloacae TaxID=550 RepID=A0AAW6NV41_ENTCL|nr:MULTISPECIES: hypothetical protein [Enterobacter]HCM9443732.1 hypothetical protein [Enterobacter cloacae subsp. cloacae]AIV29683.1 hypothetical protein EC036_20360 [Enterobacter cloacae]AOE95479.1 hypothetical protein BFJ73_09745 [Enterobacter cloacae]EMB9073117.1 hypothetical protein [Enterobacter cloacae]MCK7101936.1 hypothetical protein [Enterobacter cloacae]